MDPFLAAFVIVVCLGAFVAGMRQGRAEATPRSAYAPNLSDLDASTLRELKPPEQDAIREASAALVLVATQLGEIRGRLNEANSSHRSSGDSYRQTLPTPVERSLDGALDGLHQAQTFLKLPTNAAADAPALDGS